MKILPHKRAAFQKAILAWYKKHGRADLPWRQGVNFYAIVVAEIMLQQTNVPKVVTRYTQFLQRFPDWASLAKASPQEVLAAWEGLGYNRRALYLQRMAQAVINKYNGELPRDPEELRTLPGMGPYTSNAVLVFAHNQNLSASDVNIARVVRRWHGLAQWDIGEANKTIAQFVPKGKSRDWHSALMDFASQVCTKRAPRCLECPVAKLCRSYPSPQEVQMRKRVEPGVAEQGRHVPRRIFRGRIVQVLRSGAVPVRTLGPKIKSDWSSSDQAWLQPLLQQLAREGMIEQTRGRWQLKNA